MDYRRRVYIPKWLKDVARKWKAEGVTNREIQARLSEIGVEVSLATICEWFSHRIHVRNVMRNL